MTTSPVQLLDNDPDLHAAVLSFYEAAETMDQQMIEKLKQILGVNTKSGRPLYEICNDIVKAVGAQHKTSPKVIPWG